MKKRILLSILFFSLLGQSAYSQGWQWANSAGGVFPYDRPTSICQDKEGNTYVTGSVQGSLPFETDQRYAIFNRDTLKISGVNDIYLAKYDTKGKLQWVKNFGGSYDNWNNQKMENGVVLIYNPATNAIYITGFFIGNGSVGRFPIYANGRGDQQVFLAKFDLEGNCLWAKYAGGVGEDYGLGLACYPDGSLYISGTTQSYATFDKMKIENGGYLAKYDDSGNCLWVKNIIHGIKIYPGYAGAPYVMKVFDNDIFILIQKHSYSMNLDSILFEGSGYPVVVSRFDSSGKVKWAKEVGGPNLYYCNISMDSYGNSYLCGQFFGKYAIFEKDTLYTKDHTDFFLAKYDKDAHFQWVRQGNATKDGEIIGCSSDAEGNVYVTGSFSGEATLGKFKIKSSSDTDMFIARYDTNGECLGVRQAANGEGYDVSALSDGSCIVVGTYAGSITFDATTLISRGYEDIFVAKSGPIKGEKGVSGLSSSQLFIYANPTSGKCNIIIPDEFMKEKDLTLYIYDNGGKIIRQIPMVLGADKVTIDLEQEAKGIYNAVLSNGAKKYYGKIIFD